MADEQLAPAVDDATVAAMAEREAERAERDEVVASVGAMRTVSGDEAVAVCV